MTPCPLNNCITVVCRTALHGIRRAAGSLRAIMSDSLAGIACCMLLSLIPLCASAQLAVGSWKTFPVFDDVSRIIETPHTVYYLSGGHLYCYDKEHDETRAYSSQGELSDNGISDIYYNFESGYLLVAYDNANIDLLYDDGSRVNLPDIKSAVINSTKAVNDVKFSDGEIYVATPFGLVIYSDTRHEVRQSGNYNKEIVSLAVTDSHIIVALSGENTPLYAIPRGERINSFSSFTHIGTASGKVTALHTVDSAEGTIIGLVSDALYSITLGGEPLAAGMAQIRPYTSVSSLIPVPSAIYFRNANTLHRIDRQGNVTDECVIPEPLRSGELATLKGASSLWSGSADGVGEFKVDAAGLTVLHDRYRPDGAMSFGNICKLFPLSGESGFVATNLGMNQIHPVGASEGYGTLTKANIITPGSVDVLHPLSASGAPLTNPTFALCDPDDPSLVYYGAATGEGVIVTRDDKEIARFTSSNSKLYNNRPSHAVIDSQGNLWIAVFTADVTGSPIAILPAAARRRNPSEITAADWVRPSLGEYILSKDVRMVVCGHSNACIVFDSQYMGGLVGFDHAGTVSDTSDDRYIVHSQLYDTEGRTFTPSFIFCGVEDKRGRVWLGTSQGVVEITHPADALNPDFAVKRIKVPRNDGSNLADYLLESDEIYAIAVDSSNRKWIGTKHSGLYLVSEDGDEIIANYTTDNSPLPANTISALYADPNSNSVYVGTLSGMLEFASASSPARPDFSDVYAYPNPVTPGYTGWITVTGLMDSSQVRIVDASMHLVYHTVSQGGMALWDGCTENGERVRSGVYYVLASAGPSGSEEGDVVTKILVVN